MHIILKATLISTAATLLVACNSRPNVQAADANARLGLAYIKQHKPVLAKAALDKAIQEDPKSVNAIDSVAYFQEYVRKNKKAVYQYLKAVELNPKSAKAHNNYGAYLCRHKRYKSAIQQFLLAADNKAYAYTATAYINAATCAMKIPDYKLAKDLYVKALETSPKSDKALLGIARAAFHEGDTNLAKRFLARFATTSKPTRESRELSIKIAATSKT